MNKNYIDSAYYQIRLTARYLKVFSTQLFDGLDLGVSFDEFVALDLIFTNEDMCQRDLAKLLFKDRANTGRVAASLENKGFVAIHVDTKNKRLIKKLVITEAGKAFREKALSKIAPKIEHISKYFSDEEEKKLFITLKKCREVLNKLIENQI